MEKRFFIWKDPGCAGVNVEWLELTGTEFHALLERPENKSRRFIRLGSGMDLDLDMIYLEVTETQYRDWAKEHNARKYRSRRDRDFSMSQRSWVRQDPRQIGSSENSLYQYRVAPGMAMTVGTIMVLPP
jgi:hypothetical protein